MRLILPDSLRAELFVYVREALPEEACGFLLGSGNGETVRAAAVQAARNLHPHREDRFHIDPLEYAKAERICRKRAADGWRVLGFWHSHPQSAARPSAIDLEQARGLFASFPARYLYVIVAPNEPEDAQLMAWRLDEAGQAFEAVRLEG
ncbi:MAG: M67 family metallopeptidase [Planctomycetota bacterium]|nr:M67 family metallopeptidase [Planctomycetota bacterium]